MVCFHGNSFLSPVVGQTSGLLHLEFSGPGKRMVQILVSSPGARINVTLVWVSLHLVGPKKKSAIEVLFLFRFFYGHSFFFQKPMFEIHTHVCRVLFQFLRYFQGEKNRPSLKINFHPFPVPERIFLWSEVVRRSTN